MLWLLSVWSANGDLPYHNNPYQLMHDIADRTFERMNHEQQTISQNPNYLRFIVRQEIMPFVHTRYISAMILGNLFKTLEPTQQQRYFQAVEDYLEQSCAQLLANYRHLKYQIESEKPFAGRQLVAIRLHFLSLGSTPLRIDFKWRQNSKNQQWQLSDISVEGISLVMTKQQEWSTLLKQLGFEAFIKQLHTSTNHAILLPVN